MLRRAEGGDAAAARAVHQLDQSRASSTWENYDTKFRAFYDFCLKNGYCPFPADPAAVVHYVGQLEHDYRTTMHGVHPDNIQPYLSAINTTHLLAGEARPALGPLVQSARRGYKRSVCDNPVTHRAPPMWRAAILPHHMDLLLESAVHSDSTQTVREVGALAVSYLFGERPVSVAAVLRNDIIVTPFSIQLTETRTKTKNAAPTRQFVTLSDRRGFNLNRLFSRLLAAPITMDGARVFPELPLDNPSGVLTNYVERRMHAIGAVASAGEHYTSYSMRRGCATAMYALNVDTMKALFWGNWQDPSSYKMYIDTKANLSAGAARSYFGFLAPREA